MYDRTITQAFAIGTDPGAGDPIAYNVGAGLVAFGAAAGTGNPFWVLGANDLMYLTTGGTYRVTRHRQRWMNFWAGAAQQIHNLHLMVVRFEPGSNPLGTTLSNLAVVDSRDISATLNSGLTGEHWADSGALASPIEFTVASGYWYSAVLAAFGNSRPAANTPSPLFHITTVGLGPSGRAWRITQAGLTGTAAPTAAEIGGMLHQQYSVRGAYARTELETACRKLISIPTFALTTTAKAVPIPVPIGASPPPLLVQLQGAYFRDSATDFQITGSINNIGADGVRAEIGGVLLDGTGGGSRNIRFGPVATRSALETTAYGVAGNGGAPDRLKYEVNLQFRGAAAGAKSDCLFMASSVNDADAATSKCGIPVAYGGIDGGAYGEVDYRHRSIYAGTVGRAAAYTDGLALALLPGMFLSLVASAGTPTIDEVSIGWEPVITAGDSMTGGPQSTTRVGYLPHWLDVADYGAGAPASAPALRQIIRACISGSRFGENTIYAGLAQRWKGDTPGIGDLCELWGAAGGAGALLSMACFGANDVAAARPIAVNGAGDSTVLSAVLAEVAARSNSALVVGLPPSVSGWGPPATFDQGTLAALVAYNLAWRIAAALHGALWVDPYTRFMSNIQAESGSWYAPPDTLHLSTTAARVREYCLWLLDNLAEAELPEEAAGPAPALKLALMRQGRRR